MRLKLATFNICHGMGIDKVTDLGRTIEVIRASGADLIGLQEVDRHFGERSGWEDQPERLSHALGMHVAYGPNLELEEDPQHPGVRRQYGTAILSRYPVEYAHNHPLPQVIVPGAWNEKRGILEAHIRIGGRLVRFLNTHLGLAAEERSLQTKVLSELVDAGSTGNLSSSPIVLTGDFNTSPEQMELASIGLLLQDSYATAHEGAHGETFLILDPGKKPEQARADRCIDYIFVSSALRVVGSEVLRTYVSDHLPIVTEVEW
ncbi:endonuclease/exonuclease/phosphatase family protein [Paenibacillus koleovorans]|uniref:endonuclease/exonuclease/phosphatase family protein n=1 Tax=Paenibacillus koleovorans TaxID=121608 RepID=UPI000FDBAF7B|nr:endonuclease/exonuclease/phosphatase family protein [Paenibacillus koleovorans]